MNAVVEKRPGHPIVEAAAAYWQSKRHGRRMPSRADLDPCDIPRLLPNILLLDVTYQPLNFRYRLIGTGIDYHLNEPRTGQQMRDVPHQAPGSMMWATLESVVTSRQPVRSRIPYVGPHRDFKVCEDIILPLSDDDEHVTGILAAVAFIKKESATGDQEVLRKLQSSETMMSGISSGR